MCFSISAGDCAAATVRLKPDTTSTTPSTPATTNVASNLVTMSSFAPPPRRCHGPLFPFGLLDASTLTEEHFSTFHHGLRQRRVRMDHELHILRRSAHLDRQRTLGNQLPRSRTGDADAKHAAGLRF